MEKKVFKDIFICSVKCRMLKEFCGSIKRNFVKPDTEKSVSYKIDEMRRNADGPVHMS